MSITEERRQQIIERLRKSPPEQVLVWDDANERCFTNYEVLEALSGSLAPTLPTQAPPPIARDPELGELMMRPVVPMAAQLAAGADVLRLYRGDSSLDLGGQETLEKIAQDIYEAMNKAYEFRHVIIATISIEKKPVPVEREPICHCTCHNDPLYTINCDDCNCFRKEHPHGHGT